MTEEPRSLSVVQIYTDGGADPNPGAGGWGAVLVHPASGRSEELRGGEPRSTNNRMELTAAICALEALRQRCRVELYTDSQYLRRGITEWLPGWIARGWRRKDGELQNEDLWRRLADVAARHDIHWQWLKGHAGHRFNERADQLATAAIREQRAAAPAAGGTAPAGVAGAAAEYQVFLRISCSKRGAGWAALIRPALAAGAGAAHPANADAGQPGGAADSARLADAAESVLTGALPAGKTATSNALDLVAAVAVLERLPGGASAAIHTASDYLRHGASRWLPAWQKRAWKTQEGNPVLNRELWQRLAALQAARRIEWPEVKDREIGELDRLGALARAAAEGAQRPTGDR
jgi:ribonuclease HI